MADHRESPTDLHNRLAGEIVTSIVRPVIANGGSMQEVLVLTESVLVGVSLACVRLGGDDKMLDVMVEGARRRLAEIRQRDIETEGRG
jgi:hypothetical protein